MDKSLEESRFRPFEPLPFTERSPLELAQGVIKEADAHAALQSRLALHGVRSVRPDVASELLLTFDVSGATARRILVELWQHAFKKLLFRDDQVDTGEAAYLEELRSALGLTGEEVARARAEVPEI